MTVFHKNSDFYNFYGENYKNYAFKVGEKAKYKFSYAKVIKGILTAGYGEIEVLGITNIDTTCFKIQAKGGTTKLAIFLVK